MVRTSEEIKRQLFEVKKNGEVKNDKNHFILISFVAVLVVLVVCSRFNIQQNRIKMYEAIEWTHSKLFFAKSWNNASEKRNIFTSVAVPVTLGIITMIFSWMIVFFDSITPGISPPSPLSPRKYRKLSGHDFHTAYVVAVANGVACSILISCWI